jgi:glycosyltransferase involved in cell wall biosynthesis
MDFFRKQNEKGSIYLYNRMRIAVNTRFLLSDYLEGYGYFLNETFSRITKNHPEHEFIFIFDKPFNKKFLFASNVKAVVAGPPARHPLLWKLWYDIKLPAILKKYRADIFVSCDGFCSLNTKVPQCLAVHDLAFLHFPSFIKKSHLLFYKRYTPKFLIKAKSVITVSEFSKHDIITQYKIEADKINVVYSAAKEIFQPLEYEAKQKAKDKYTDGKEYFIYAGAIHPRKNLMNLLKAFSAFKKRQQSGLKLVLAGRLAWKYESFTKSLQSYKYRNDVILTGYLEEEELVKLIGAAYAMVYPSLWEGFGVPVLEAMHCAVPVITTVNSSMQEIAQEGALYADANNYLDIADKMMLLYKNENLRKEMVIIGKVIAQQYHWDKTADLLWQSIVKAVE